MKAKSFLERLFAKETFKRAWFLAKFKNRDEVDMTIAKEDMIPLVLLILIMILLLGIGVYVAHKIPCLDKSTWGH